MILSNDQQINLDFVKQSTKFNPHQYFQPQGTGCRVVRVRWFRGTRVYTTAQCCTTAARAGLDNWKTNCKQLPVLPLQESQ